jgi:hypothetical protein
MKRLFFTVAILLAASLSARAQGDCMSRCMKAKINKCAREHYLQVAESVYCILIVGEEYGVEVTCYEPPVNQHCEDDYDRWFDECWLACEGG